MSTVPCVASTIKQFDTYTVAHARHYIAQCSRLDNEMIDLFNFV